MDVFSNESAAHVPVTFEEDRDVPRRSQLLLLLLGHELDRIRMWFNPQGLANMAVVPPEVPFTSSQSFQFLTAQWSRCIETAWHVSPKLAMQLGVRFPYRKPLKILRYVVAERADEACLADPTAAQYLVTPERAEAQLPQLKSLLYCGNVAPPHALAFLGKEYQSNPYVTQFSIRVLRTFPADTLIFYLPQLLQALRYDTTNLVFEYLVEMGTRSQLLAHQLLWCAKSYEDEQAANAKYAIADKAKLIQERVLESFGPEELQNYHAEFDFFEKVTNISGTLLQYPTKELRRPVLRSELEKIKVDTGASIYLPTNPNSTVISINPQRAAPLQSHAHAPILVTFNVTNQRALDDTRFSQMHLEEEEEEAVAVVVEANGAEEEEEAEEAEAVWEGAGVASLGDCMGERSSSLSIYEPLLGVRTPPLLSLSLFEAPPPRGDPSRAFTRALNRSTSSCACALARAISSPRRCSSLSCSRRPDTSARNCSCRSFITLSECAALSSLCERLRFSSRRFAVDSYGTSSLRRTEQPMRPFSILSLRALRTRYN
eukprot:TRINITY_DN3642_c1_g1_i2.p1 TRINITY_DN3642_c1_g1~~TRINITY_DN3642_c1_g1_i2.p1  ORF type:complete len:594 (-),score=213.92 TRINITY_DN3642_c1_g1_i2:227-1858(-)